MIPISTALMGSARIMFRPALPTRCPSGTPLKSTTSALCPALQVIRPLGAENRVNGSGGPGSHPGTHGPEERPLNICCACAMACSRCCWLITYNCATVNRETSRFVNTFGRIAVATLAPAGSDPFNAVSGAPIWKLKKELICQPPRSLPTNSLCFE